MMTFNYMMTFNKQAAHPVCWVKDHKMMYLPIKELCGYPFPESDNNHY